MKEEKEWLEQVGQGESENLGSIDPDILPLIKSEQVCKHCLTAIGLNEDYDTYSIFTFHKDCLEDYKKEERRLYLEQIEKDRLLREAVIEELIQKFSVLIRTIFNEEKKDNK